MSENTSGWAPGTVALTLGTGATAADFVITERRVVDGFIWESFGITKIDGEWRVTHLPTGAFISYARNKRSAQKFCEEIAPLLDWASVQPGEDVPTEVMTAILTSSRRARGWIVADAAQTPEPQATGAAWEARP